jgi:uncharacterized membrane protein
MSTERSARTQFVIALGASGLVSLGLFAYGAARNHSSVYSYLIWNLFLAWLPLVFAVRLTDVLQRKRWSSWEGIAYSMVWLIFLPNSFYMISDFIHLQEVARVDLLFDVIMFTSFIFNGLVLGFSSLYLIHAKLAKRFSSRTVVGMLGVTLLVCSGAIYIGRDLRWNSWDVVTNPGGLLFDVSDRLTHPASFPQMLVTVITFFVLLSSMYMLLWRGSRLLQRMKTV